MWSISSIFVVSVIIFGATTTLVSSSKVVKAARRGDTKSILILLRSGEGDVDECDEAGCTPLYAALQNDKEAAIKFLVGLDANVEMEHNGERPLHLAVKRNLLASAEVILNAGANPNIQDAKSQTPIYYAIYPQHEVMVRLLIRKHAKLDVVNSIGYSPLHSAIIRGAPPEIVAALIEGGGNVFERFSNSRTFLHSVTSLKRVDIMEVLIAKGAAIDAKDDRGITALHIACMDALEDATVRKFLLSRGANVNVLSADMDTPLHFAAGVENNADVVDSLLAKGAYLEAINKYRQSPLDVAVAKNAKAAACKLVECGADVSVKFDVMLRTFFPSSYQKAITHRFVGFDDYVITLIKKYAKESEETTSTNSNVIVFMKSYISSYAYTLYRLALPLYKALMMPRRLSALESRKQILFKDIVSVIMSKTYLLLLPFPLIADVLFCVGYYGWKMERLSFDVALASYNLNVSLEYVKNITTDIVKDFFKTC